MDYLNFSPTKNINKFMYDTIDTIPVKNIFQLNIFTRELCSKTNYIQISEDNIR